MDYLKTFSLSAFLSPGALSMLQTFSGAVLGASFYVLLRAQPYLVNRSYDPKYNAMYISRLITGVVAGIILSIGLQEAIGHSNAAFTPGALAILGGYAAEAVEVILKRLVDVLLAIFQGAPTEQPKANPQPKKVSTSSPSGATKSP
ncbi:hypothetical protein [Paraburkholderia sp. BL6669N2]|uniref:hypothetical protein n=1 Tax=Paraburkholderia sp. BL6669N2 TaxID=1938807 RepID=UPI000E26DDD9|nr:hypothetical protein [Paraburkholderia sp. BL6669N2]